MAIKFLKDYSVGSPAEQFTAGQVVDNRDEASEAHFVRRGVAAYLRDKKLYDFDGNELEERERVEVVVKTVAKGGKSGRAGVGDPGQATGGPSEVVVNSDITAGETKKAKA